jgi:hypothetical protein
MTSLEPPLSVNKLPDHNGKGPVPGALGIATGDALGEEAWQMREGLLLTLMSLQTPLCIGCI